MACWRIYFQLNWVIIGDVMDGLFPVRHKLLPNCKIRSIRKKERKGLQYPPSSIVVLL